MRAGAFTSTPEPSNHTGASDWEEAAEDDMLAPGEWGRVVASVANRPVSLEEAGVLPPLSKFVLRQGNKAVAFGRCTKILG